MNDTMIIGKNTTIVETPVLFDDNNTTLLFLNNHTNSTASPTSANSAQSSLQIMALPLLLLFCYSTRSSIPHPRYRRAAIERAERRRELESRDPVRRKQVIESCLITKVRKTTHFCTARAGKRLRHTNFPYTNAPHTFSLSLFLSLSLSLLNTTSNIQRVTACDEHKNLTLGDIPDVEEKGEEDDLERNDCANEESLDCADDSDDSGCAICLGPFRVGDQVAWSKRMECRHVFHKECLMEWLENPEHNECPSCRFIIVHDDEEEEGCEKGDAAAAEEDDDGFDAQQNFAFVIMNGLISPLRRASYSLIAGNESLADEEDSGDSRDEGDEDANDKNPFRRNSVPHQLRRVLSAGANESSIGVALRRVSSGIYSKLTRTKSYNHDDSDDDDRHNDSSSSDDDEFFTLSPHRKTARAHWKKPIPFRRSLSEGYSKADSFDSNDDARGADSLILRRGSLVRRGSIRRTLSSSSSSSNGNNKNVQYARLSATFEDSVEQSSSSFPQEEWDDEDEEPLEPRTLFTDQRQDLEMGIAS